MKQSHKRRVAIQGLHLYIHSSVVEDVFNSAWNALCVHGGGNCSVNYVPAS